MGPQGCGKSTVLNALDELGYPSIERKTARSVLDDYGLTLDEIYSDKELHKRFQDDLLIRKIKDEDEHIESSELIFTERSYLDLFAYATQNLSCYKDCHEWLNTYYDVCQKYQSYYKRVYFIKGGMFKVEDDGVRGAGGHFAIQIEALLKAYMDPEKTKIIDVLDIDDRVQTIIKDVQSFT